MSKSAKYYIGLDLGQQQDYTALTVLEGQPAGDQSGGEVASEYHLRHMHRFEIGTPYQEVAARTKAVQAKLPGKSYLLADATGVGRPVMEMLREEDVKRLKAITITGGDSVSQDGSEYRVPKRDLVGAVQVLLQTGRLRFASGLEEGPTLRAELQNFKAKIDISTGHDSYEALREGAHDDLVLSLAMACWYAEYVRQNSPPNLPRASESTVIPGWSY